MKKLLLAGGPGRSRDRRSAGAADLPRRTEPVAPIMPPAIPIFTWTGFYVGVQAGYAWGGNGRDFGTLTAVDLDGDGITDVTAVDSGAFGDDDGNDGFVGGAHTGYNYQFGSIVVGAEADIEATGVEGGRSHAFVDRVRQPVHRPQRSASTGSAPARPHRFRLRPRIDLRDRRCRLWPTSRTTVRRSPVRSERSSPATTTVSRVDGPSARAWNTPSPTS